MFPILEEDGVHARMNPPPKELLIREHIAFSIMRIFHQHTNISDDDINPGWSLT